MRKSAVIILILFFVNAAFAQSKERKVANLKQIIYVANKAKVLKFSMKDFDCLFFEFSNKKAVAEASNKNWFSESYEDYSLSKQSQQ